MVNERRSLWSRLFGVNKNSCCDVHIEELAKEKMETPEIEGKEEDVKKAPKQSFPCCGAPPAGEE